MLIRNPGPVNAHSLLQRNLCCNHATCRQMWVKVKHAFSGRTKSFGLTPSCIPFSAGLSKDNFQPTFLQLDVLVLANTSNVNGVSYRRPFLSEEQFPLMFCIRATLTGGLTKYGIQNHFRDIKMKHTDACHSCTLHSCHKGPVTLTTQWNLQQAA